MTIWRFGLDWPKTRQKSDDIVVQRNQVSSHQNRIHSASNSGKSTFKFSFCPISKIAFGVVLYRVRLT